MTGTEISVYIGWDSREEIAYQVCRFSLTRRASQPVKIIPLRQQALRYRRLYWREPDPLESTEFTYTRFLVPELAGYRGWAIFCDCDFLWLADVAELWGLADERYALMCVKHDHRPTETVKMDGCVQTVYPRKNWSSLMLLNCGHPVMRKLTAEMANNEPGSFLHRLQWIPDELIGGLPETWNWLEGWSEKRRDGAPNVVHFTRGGPWFDHYMDVDYGDLWLAERAAFEQAQRMALKANVTAA